MPKLHELKMGDSASGGDAFPENPENISNPQQRLAEVLLGRVEIAESDFVDGGYKRYMTDDELIVYATWLLSVIQTLEPGVVLRQSYIDIAHELGYGPQYHAYIGHGLKLPVLREKLGNAYFMPPITFNEWSKEDFANNARQLVAVLKGRRPTSEDYEDWAGQGNGPSLRTIFERFPGGITSLNELIGFRKWSQATPDEILDLGVRFMEVNGRAPVIGDIRILSIRKRGPSDSTIYAKFGSMPNYSQQVVDLYEHEGRRREEHLDDLLTEFKNLGLDDMPLANGWGDNKKAAYTARFMVAQACFPGLGKDRLMLIAYNIGSQTFVNAMLKTSAAIAKKSASSLLTVGRIELKAEELGVFEDIWELYTDDREHLRITEHESQKARAEHRRKQRKVRAAKKLAEKALGEP